LTVTPALRKSAPTHDADVRYDRTVIAYHGCDAGVARRLLAGTTTFRKSENAWDWLGEGIYFWEYGHDRALKFARDQLMRGKVVEPAVVGAVPQLGTCFDLMDTKYTAELADAYIEFRRVHRRAGQPMPQNAGRTPDKLLRHRDCAVLNFYFDGLLRAGIAYDTVRCAFAEGEPAFPHSGIHRQSHIQLAVRNPACIIGLFRPTMR
jgi:hypothetical protein